MAICQIKFSRSFRKDFKKLNIRQRIAWADRFALFRMQPLHSDLRRHKMQGKYYGMESMDVLPDLRSLFEQEGDSVTFHYIRNHNQLYS